MKKSAIGVAVSAAVLLCGPALAQSFTYEVVWEPVERVGGMDGPNGPQYMGGAISGTYTVAYGNGETATGTVRCVGMDQPDGGIFAIHMTCTTKEEGGTGSLVYGCNFLGKPGPDTPLGCVGGVQGKEGEFAGRNGGLTMEWYSESNSRGTGQWYAAN